MCSLPMSQCAPGRPLAQSRTLTWPEGEPCADKESLHVQLADESVCIGEAPSAESYLNMANIISAAVGRGADAIHPVPAFSLVTFHTLYFGHHQTSKCIVQSNLDDQYGPGSWKTAPIIETTDYRGLLTWVEKIRGLEIVPIIDTYRL